MSFSSIQNISVLMRWKGCRHCDGSTFTTNGRVVLICTFFSPTTTKKWFTDRERMRSACVCVCERYGLHDECRVHSNELKKDFFRIYSQPPHICFQISSTGNGWTKPNERHDRTNGRKHKRNKKMKSNFLSLWIAHGVLLKSNLNQNKAAYWTYRDRVDGGEHTIAKKDEYIWIACRRLILFVSQWRAMRFRRRQQKMERK